MRNLLFLIVHYIKASWCLNTENLKKMTMLLFCPCSFCKLIMTINEERYCLCFLSLILT